MAGIYIHIPFCKQACHYCDFHFSTNISIKSELLRCMAEEISIRQPYLEGEAIKTIYLGGGTPSLLSSSELESILQPIYRLFNVEGNAEITLEANPDDLTEEKLKEYKTVGINRLSLGFQSFDNDVLKFLNRAHNAEASLRSFDLARSAGFNNISIDLIYAIPHQDEKAWMKNIVTAVHLQPEHISSYSLTIEEKTTFGNWFKKGKLKPQDDDNAARQLEILVDELSKSGYEQYEVSNFSKPDFYSRHNSSYWKQEKYLGIGPSAHSYNRSSRQFNIANNHHYVNSIKEGKIPLKIEHLTNADQANEYLLTILRTSWGTDTEKLKREYGYDILREHASYIHELCEKKLMTLDDHYYIKLTTKGKLLADKIASDLFLLT